MPTRTAHAALAKAAEQRLVFACIPDTLQRARLQTTLRGHGTVRWFTSFEDLRRALEAGDRPIAAVIALTDSVGTPARTLAIAVHEEMIGTPVIVCCDLARTAATTISSLALAGVHHILYADLNDQGHAARTVIFGAVLAAAADSVVHALRPSLPDVLSRFVEVAVRQVRTCHRVSDVSLALRIPRQTIGRWCRAQRYIRPEELLVWARLFLAAVLLERTPRTVDSIASELGYASPAALRNRMREYTGMTATQVRANGLDLVLTVFARRLEEVRAAAVVDEESIRIKAG